MSAVILEIGDVVVRGLKRGDASSLARNANNPRVAAHLRDRFPHPYTDRDARDWIQIALSRDPVRNFAIAAGDEVIGGIGFEPLTDVHARSAELGYWLAEPYWGKGIATEAVRGVVRYAFQHTDLIRIFAHVFEGNPASVRVLEKAGFTCEGRMRQSVVKSGRVLDQFLYAVLRHEVIPDAR
jgi:[ribosomal protein S5]-alanine N-acetyltransferase